jgi:hypothetical protein
MSMDCDLVWVQEDTNMIPQEVEVFSCYATNCTPCKMAVTRFEQAGFGDEFIDRMNRWRVQEESKGQFIQGCMNAHYTKATLLTTMTWLGSYFL